MAKCKLPRIFIWEIKLNQGGYAAGRYGKYYGASRGSRVYEYATDDGAHEGTLRAPDQKAARALAKREVAAKHCAKEGSWHRRTPPYAVGKLLG